MAYVAVLLMQTWTCPYCGQVVKARTSGSVVRGCEYHLLQTHPHVTPPTLIRDPAIEPRHWAFNIAPDDEQLWTKQKVS